MPSTSSTGPEQEPKGDRIEAAKTRELSSLLKSLGALRESIKNNEPLSEHDVQDLGNKALGVQVQIGETAYKLSEAKNDPNVSIWLEILAGDFGRMMQVTELPAFVVRDAPTKPPVTNENETKCRQWFCPKLKILTLETAEELSKRNDQIALELSTDFSRKTAEVLAQYNTLKRQTADRTLFHSATRLTPEWAHALFHKNDNHSFGPGIRWLHLLHFKSLEKVTAETIREMYWIPKEETDKGEGWEAVALPVVKNIDLETAKAMAENPHLPLMLIGMDTVFENEETSAILLTQKQVQTLTNRTTEWEGTAKRRKKVTRDELIFKNYDIPAWMVLYHLTKTPSAEKISFWGGRTIDDALIDALSSFEGEISFEKCGPTDQALLKKVNKMHAIQLNLWLGQLSVPILEALSTFQGSLHFYDCETIDLPLLHAFSRMPFKRRIGLHGIKSLSHEIVTELAKLWDRIELPHGDLWKEVYNEKKRLPPNSVDKVS